MDSIGKSKHKPVWTPHVADHMAREIDMICDEANGALGWAIIQHLVTADSANRWMRKYHFMGSAMAIPQVGLLIHEVVTRGKQKAFYTRHATHDQFHRCISAGIGFSTEVLLGVGDVHSVTIVGVDDDSLVIFVPTKRQGSKRLGGFATISRAKVLAGNAGQPVVIGGCYAAEKQVKLLSIGIPMVAPSFDWAEFESYGQRLQELRELRSLRGTANLVCPWCGAKMQLVIDAGTVGSGCDTPGLSGTYLECPACGQE